ncbi:RND transporter, partial [Variovorax sp. CT11-76]
CSARVSASMAASVLATSWKAASTVAQALARTRAQLQWGDASALALLLAQQQQAQAEINLVQARAQRFTDAAALFQALGGGWWNAPADPASPTLSSIASSSSATP